MAIIPVPSRRSSELLVSQRLLTQIPNDQLDLLRIQDQLSTGRRIAAPSDDSSASIRASQLQLRLEQKNQVTTNLNSTRSFLSATESSVASVTDAIQNIRGLALSAANTTSSDAEREAVVVEIRRAIDHLVSTGNGEFRNRFLFGGSQSNTTPFTLVDNFVDFRGNSSSLQSFIDIDLLQDANVTANEVFGVVSQGTQGTVDLNPILTESTLLRDLNGGNGVREGSFIISDGNADSTVDIAGARTIADVIRRVEANPPPGRQLLARVASQGLTIEFSDGLGSGNLSIRDISGGTSAAGLGIRNELGSGLEPLVGNDINPVLKPSTPLRDLIGVRATAVLQSSGFNNDILLEATNRGAEFNGLRVQFVDDTLLQADNALLPGFETARYEETATAARGALTLPGLNNDLILTAKSAGATFNDVSFEIVDGGAIGNAATVAYDSVTKVLQIGIDNSDQTEIQTVIDELNLSSPFTAAYDSSDVTDGGFVPVAIVPSAAAGVTFGNTGSSGGDAGTVFVNVRPLGTTAADVVDVINSTPDVAAVVTAEFDDKEALSGQGLGTAKIGVPGFAILAGGSGEEIDLASGIQIVNGGKSQTIRFDDAETLQELLNAINVVDINVLAEINATGTGINIRSTLSGTDLFIGENGGITAVQLGVRSLTTETQLRDLNHGLGVDTLEGTDFTIRRNDGVELEIDVSAAETIQDVIDAINNHSLNLDPVSQVLARTPDFGNGIELVDSTAEGNGNLTILKGASGAAWDLGFIPRGEFSRDGSSGNPAAGSKALIRFDDPNDENTAFELVGNVPGPHLDGINIEFVDSGAVIGNVATVTFDPASQQLLIDVDQSATTIATVVSQITLEGTFTADLVVEVDGTNDGSGLVPELGLVGATGDGVANTAAEAAELAIAFPVPFNANTALSVTAHNPGIGFNGVEVEFIDSGLISGNSAQVTYSAIAGTIFVDVDSAATSANTIVDAFRLEPQFNAALDLSAPNDGTGIVGFVGSAGTLEGGTPEILRTSDVNPQEVQGLFNTLAKLADAIDQFDLRQIERTFGKLDEDLDRVNFSRAEIGSRQQFLEVVERRGEDEEVELRRMLSLEIDTDFVSAITELTGRQAAVEASLRLIGQTYQLSLLDYI